MDCRQFQNMLDDLLVSTPEDAAAAESLQHVAACGGCAQEHERAGRALAALKVSQPVVNTNALRQRVLGEASSIAAREESPAFSRPWRRPEFRFRKSMLAFALAAAALLVAAVLAGRDPNGSADDFRAISLVRRAYAAEQAVFNGERIIHIVNEIVVQPIDDAELARTRWFPIMSLEASGQPRFHQLLLSASPGEGYSVADECWYEKARGRFVRQLTVDGEPIYANAYDGEAVYWLDTSVGGAPRVVRRPITAEFRPPGDAASLLGIAAGLPARLEEDDKDRFTDAGEVELADGAAARKVQVRFPQPGADESQGASVLFTIRTADFTIARIEFLVAGKPLYEARRVTTEEVQEFNASWNLAGLVDANAEDDATPAPSASIVPDMIVSDVSVASMVEKAGFPTYIFKVAPPWAGDRQITDILDIASPPSRMFAITYRAEDGRHVVLHQSPSYNKLLGALAEQSQVIYTSPSGVKVLSGGVERDRWLAGIVLLAARAVLDDPPSDDCTGYLLQTPDGTYPALAVNGAVSEEELQALIDSLAPAADLE